MNSPADHHQANSRQALPPPMGELLMLLRSNGFFVTTDDYVSLLKIVEHFGEEGIDSLAARICPIIATTPEEQERFYLVFETYKKSQELEAPPPDVGISWTKWIVGIVVLVVVTLAIMVEEGRNRSRPVIGLPQSNRDTMKLAMGEIYRPDLLQSSIFYGREKDTADVDVRWEEAGRGEIGRGLRLQYQFAEPGLHIIRRSISSSTIPVSKAADTLWVYVCSALPRLTINAPADPIMAGTAVTLTATSESKEGTVRAYSWSIDAAAGGQIKRQTDSPDLNYKFDTAGIYNVTCTPIVDGADAACVIDARATLRVIDTGKLYGLTFAGGSGPITVQAKLKWWPGLLLLLLASGIGVWAFRREAKEKKADAKDDGSKPPARRGPPYEVPFEPVGPGDIVVDKSLRRFVQLLRHSAEEEIAELHIQRTIGATIRAGGLTDLVFAPRKMAQEYLVFVDHSAPQGMLSHLYRFVVALMEVEGVPLTHFYYDQDFNCFNAQFPAGTTLRNIADNYGSAISIVFGDGAALMESLSPLMRPKLQHEFARWELCLLITTQPVNEWGIRERILSKYFMLASADADSLLQLAQRMRRSTTLRKIGTQHGGSTSSAANDFGSVASLRAWFGQDEVLFQWLCALCIYPKPRWELIIGIGRAILSRYVGRSVDLRYDQLLHLCRIPWLAEGSFPQRLRMELLKELTVDNEIAARAALLEMLARVDKQYPGDYLFSAEKGLQDTVNRFVVYAHDPESNPGYAGAADEFYALFKDGRIVDVPLRKYLDKPDDRSWATPLVHQGSAVSMSHYFDIREGKRQQAETGVAADQRRKRRRRQAIAAVAMILLAGLWSVLFFSSMLRTNPVMAGLYSVDPAREVELSYQVQRDFSACGDSSTVFRLLPGTLSINNQPYPLQFDEQKQTLSASAPYAAIQQAGSSAMMMLGTGGANAAIVEIPQLSASGVLTATCTKFEPGFGPGALPEVLNELWAGQENGRLMNIILDRQQIYEASAPLDGFDRYSIDTVIHAKGIYKIIAHASLEYNAFIISNIQPGSFGLIACDQRFQSIGDALKASELCGKYETMKLYYDHKDTGKIYLPVANADMGFSPLVGEERTKVLNKLIAHSASDEAVYFEQFNNSFYIRTQKPYDLSKELSAYNVAAAARVYRKSMKELGQNPFQRPYLTLSFGRGASIKNEVRRDTTGASAENDARLRKERQRAAAEAEKRRLDEQQKQQKLQAYDSMMKNNYQPQRTK